MREGKYVVFRGVFMNNIVLFGNDVSHDAIANGRDVVSAGFWQIVERDGNAICKCYGMSASLRRESDEENDSQLLAELLARMPFFRNSESINVVAWKGD